MLLSQILRHAERNPGKIAIYGNGTPITYAAFATALLKIRHHLAETLPPISGVAIVATKNLSSQWFHSIALRSLGITTVVPRDPATTEKLMQAPGTVLVCGSRHMGAVPAIKARWPDLPIFEIPPSAIRSISDDILPSAIEDDRFGDNIEFSSGTTGDAKLMIRPGAAVEALWTRTAAEFRIDETSIFHLQDIGAWTAVGAKLPLTCWALGATCVFDRRTDWRDHMLDLPINRLFITPGQFKTIAAQDFPIPPGPALQVYCGGGFLAGPLAIRLRDKLQCRVFFNYGGTEFGVRLQNEVQVEEDAVWLRPVPNADLRLVDERGRPAADDEEAIIQVKRHSCDPVPFPRDADEAAGAEAGYFNTSDLAIRRADGRIRIVGRTEDMINVGGNKLPLAPLEDKARTILGIDTLCLLVRHADNGEEYLVVAVEGDQTLDRERANTFVSRIGAKFHRTEFRAFAAFPRHSEGMQKVDRRALLRLIEQPQ